MTRYLASIVVLTALGLPNAALAKEPVKATVCGADGCVTSTDKGAILPLVEGGPPTNGPRAGAPAYRVRVTIATGRRSTDSFTNWMSPRLRLIRGSEGSWMTLPAATLAALRHVAGDLTPFPATRMPISSAPPERGDSLPPETFTPVSEHATVPAAGSDWPWLAAIGAAAIGALAAALIFRRRRRSRGIPSGGVLGRELPH